MIRRGVVSLVVVFLVIASAGGPSLAQKRESAEIGDKQRDLQQTQKRLLEERQKAADAKKREAGLLAELETIDKRLTTKRKQIRALDERIKDAQLDIGRLRADIARLDRSRSGQQDALERKLCALYKVEAEGGALPLVLARGDSLARAVQIRHLATLASVDARLIQEYRVTSESLADRKARLEVRQAELTALRGQAEAERADADRQAARRQVLLARVKDERVYHDRMVGELSEAARRLEPFVRERQEKQRRAPAAQALQPHRAEPIPRPTGTPGTGFAALRGRLAWPADGRIVGEFRAQVNPRFGTKTLRNGIDID